LHGLYGYGLQNTKDKGKNGLSGDVPFRKRNQTPGEQPGKEENVRLHGVVA
jgi:hypothetical protein